MYSSEVREKIVNAVCEGIGKDTFTSVEKILSSFGDGCPSESAVHRWIEEDDDFSKMYSAARVSQAHKALDIILDLIKKEKKDIDNCTNLVKPKKATSLFNKCRWVAEKLAPRHYGERQAMLVEEMYGKLESFIKKELDGNAD